MTSQPQRPMTAAMLTYGNPRQVATWSGIPSHMLAALEPHFDFVTIVEEPLPRWFFPLGRALKALSLRRFQYSASRRYTRLAMQRTVATLDAAQPDVVFAVSCSPIAHAITSRHKVVYIADATWRQMIGYYELMTISNGVSAGRGDALEETCIADSDLIFYPSRWAADSARADYGADPAKVFEIPWGANIPAGGGSARRLGDGPLILLFVGIEWDRKGGPLAVATAAALNARGIDCRLDIVGNGADVMKGAAIPPNVHFHGRLRKSDPADAALMDRLFREAHLFFLPTKAECYGIVFAEAATHGLPSVSTLTGGVPSVVKNGETGVLLPETAGADDFAAAIAALAADPGRYAALSAAALVDAADRLNWTVWAENTAAIIKARLGRA